MSQTHLNDRREFLRRVGGVALGFATPGFLGCAATRPESGLDDGDELFTTVAPPEIELLPSPDLSEARIMRTVAGIRPYRRGGIRLERVSLSDGRPLVHDYGHGGAGITLSWGCAEEVGDLLDAEDVPPVSVAVIGGGIIGLTSAWVLAERGYSVSIHSEHFSPGTTSDVAGGQWAPSLVALDRRPERRTRFARILRGSHRRFVAHLGEHYGVSHVDNYTASGGGAGLRRIPPGILPPARRLERLPFVGPPRPGRLYHTLLIEPPVYLPRLQSDLDALGVERVQFRFESADEIANLPVDAVVNCTGLGSRALYGDRRLVPVRGQLVLLEPQALPYLLSHDGYIFPRRDAVVLGGTAEWNVTDRTPNPAAAQRILAKHRKFFAAGAT